MASRMSADDDCGSEHEDLEEGPASGFTSDDNASEIFADSPDGLEDEPVFTSNSDTGGIFANSHDFTVAGGTFINKTNNYGTTPTVLPDLHMIPVADIELRRELENSTVVRHRPENGGVRRLVYSAKVGRRSDLTVAMYQGDSAEEEWRRDIERYMSIRHPNIMQIWAGAGYGKLHATVFHGDLVPFKEFMAGQSPIITVYLYALYNFEWKVYNLGPGLNRLADYWYLQRVEAYLCSALSQSDVYSSDHTLWIRSSTGQLTADIQTPDADKKVWLLDITHVLQGFTNHEATAIESLSLRNYHLICSNYLNKPWHEESISTAATVTPLGVVPSSWPQPVNLDWHNSVGIAILPADILDTISWSSFPADLGWGDLMESGWMRYESGYFGKSAPSVNIFRAIGPDDYTAWLSQANHIFSSLGITSHLGDYVLVDGVQFKITLSDSHPPPCTAGYLFLCPPAEFKIGTTSYRWPDTPAYWSLDPAGVHRLSMEEATGLGFPAFQLYTYIWGKSWDTSVYAGLRKFHEAKGFNPDSQDVARHLHLPLFELAPGVQPVFDVEGLDEEDTEYESWSTAEEGDWGSDEKEKQDSIETEGPSVEETEEEGTNGDLWNEFDSDDGDSESNTVNQPHSVQTTGACSGPGTSGVRDISSEFRLPAVDENIPVALKYLNNAKLALILFLTMCWVWDNM